jgi:ATP-dependent Zn protease
MLSKGHVCSIVPPVILVILAVLLENSGLMKAGPRQTQFEPVQGKVVKFSDVHGVDEAKEVRRIHLKRYLCLRLIISV